MKAGVEVMSSKVRLPKEVFNKFPFICTGDGAEETGLSICWRVHDEPWMQKPCSRYLGQMAAIVYYIHPDARVWLVLGTNCSFS